jgi:putative membrane protein
MRLARQALRAHVALQAFSGIAFATFLVPPIPAFFQRPMNQAIMDVSYRFGGQLTVTIGAVAGIAFLSHAVGWRRTLQALALVFVIAFTAEAVGTVTGAPFGPYIYTDRLGYRLFGLVPFNIPTSWFYMLVASLGIASRLLLGRDDGMSRWWWAFVAALIMTAWDLVMDPAMFETEHWLWQVPDLSSAPTWQRLLGYDGYFGIPVVNFLGWILTATIVARTTLALIPPSEWVARVAPHDFPLALYAANGLLPIVICLRGGMVPAGVVGIVVMGVPLWCALRATQSSGEC